MAPARRGMTSPEKKGGITALELQRAEVIMPGGIPLTLEAERHLEITPETWLLSVACGTGEIECYLALKYGCQVLGVDVRKDHVARAQEKARARGLGHLVQLAIGDGNALQVGAGTFDLVYCSGAFSDYLGNGLAEFYRVLKPGGRAVVIDIIFRSDHVPPHVEEYWSVGATKVTTLAGRCRDFAGHGFGTLFAQGYHQPSWWEAYYEDREPTPGWQAERARYRVHKDYVGVGLFVMEKD